MDVVGGLSLHHASMLEGHVIVMGAVLLILGFITGLGIRETVGALLLIVGLVLLLVGSVGRPLAGPRHYW